MLKKLLFLFTNLDNHAMERSKILILLLLFTVSDAYSQQLSNQVFLPAAGVSYKGGISYSQTMGETAVELVSSTDYVLTQGFQQPRLKATIIKEIDGNGVKVYPNPVIDYVDVELFGDKARTFIITIVNISGTIIHSDNLSFGEKFWHIQEIPVTNLVRGFYLVRVTSKDGVISRTFKIEKM